MKKILILQGGFNEEHVVSLKTANEVANTLKELKIRYKTLTVNPSTFSKDITNFSNEYICFNALHGPFGEDGEIQKILKKNNFRFTHSNQNVSSNCFDKIKSKKIIIQNKIHTPKYIIIKNKNLNEKNLLNIKKKLNIFVIKPVRSGSSHGLTIIKSKKDLNNFIKELQFYKNKFKKNDELLIEKYISGKELTVSVINKCKSLQSLAVTEIISLNKLYDYKAKYTKGFSKHFIPARITKKNYTKCLNLALKIHKIFKCNAISRIDFIYNKKQNKIYFLEINSQPGMTKLSLLPEQANYKNISFESIVLDLINNSK